MSTFRPLHHTFAPLGDTTQRLAAVSLLVQPWKWKKGTAQGTLRKALHQRFEGEAFLFSSGREALLAILRSFKLTPGEEVIVQGYTCIVVPNAIIAAGCVPVFADIGRDTLNLDLEAVEKAITPRTRAVICQHTFGIPADTAKLRDLCDKHSLLLIEDCAHIIPDAKGPASIGEYGDALFFSFGRDKAISGVTGGAAVSRHGDLSQMLLREEEKAQDLPLGIIGILLLYPLLYALCRPFYALGIGKAALAACGKAGLLRPINMRQEKRGIMSTTLHRMPNACAALALAQWNKLEALNDHRRMLTRFYLSEGMARNWFALDPLTGDSPLPLALEPDLPLQKFPFFVLQADNVRAQLRASNIHLADGWTNCVICPENADAQSSGYVPGSDVSAEAVCHKILSLPTHPGMTLRDAAFLVQTLDGLLKMTGHKG